MHRVSHIRCIALLLFVVFFFPQLAKAQIGDPITGRLDAYASRNLPAPLVIDIQLLDNVPHRLRLRDLFIQRAKEDGIKVVAGAPLILSLDIQVVRDFRKPEKDHVGELHIGKSGGVSLRGKLWSSSKDSILGGRKNLPDQTLVDRLYVTADLDDRNDGRNLWYGKIRYELRGRDPNHAARQFMPVLAGAIGQTHHGKTVTVYD